MLLRRIDALSLSGVGVLLVVCNCTAILPLAIIASFRFFLPRRFLLRRGSAVPEAEGVDVLVRLAMGVPQ